MFRKLLENDDNDYGMPFGCYVSPAKAASLLIADGADPYVKGFVGYAMAAGFVCPFKVTEDACNAANGCLWGTTDYDEEGAKPSCRCPGWPCSW